MNVIAVAIPLFLVAFIVFTFIEVGRKWPRASLFVITGLPMLALLALVGLFSLPAIQTLLNPDAQFMVQLLSVSVGAIIGIVGAGTIAIVQERWSEDRQKIERDWTMRTALASRLSSYPYNPNALTANQRGEIKEILAHAKNDADEAIRSGVIPNQSVFARYVKDMDAHYQPQG